MQIPGLELVTSNNGQGFSSFVLQFDLSKSLDGAATDVQAAITRAYHKDQEFTAQQQHLFESARDAARLSEIRFKAGTTDYLEVLTNETNSLSAELELAQAQGNELIALVQLYQALGGGWQ